MCGRFAWDDKVDEQIRQFVAAGNDYRDWTPEEWDRWKPNYQVSPTDQIPIVVETLVDRDEPEGPTVTRVEAARWWLTPSWSKTLEMKVPTFNARSEELSQKASFKDSIGSKRAVIPMLGFYEWTKYPKPGEKKKAYFLHDPAGDYLFAAGLYSWWADPAELKAKRGTEEPVDWHLTVTMLTTDMVGPFKAVHPRSPVFLPKDRIGEWLNPKLKGDQTFVDAIAAAAVPEIEALEFHEVAPLKQKSHGPELILPV